MIPLFSVPDEVSNRNDLGIFFAIFLYGNICYDPSLEPSWQDDFNEGPQHMFSLRN